MERVVEGIVERVSCHLEESGFSVFEIAEDGGNISLDCDTVTCVGVVPEINVGESVHIYGTEVVHPTYGPQIKIISMTKTEPKSERAIELYLASGAVKGIGKTLAKRIIKEFGVDTLKVIDSSPDELVRIKGISPKKAEQISLAYHEQADLRNALLFLAEYGISANYALRIYKKYKSRTLDVVRSNPYAIAEDVFGIGFKIADNIAEKVGISKSSPYRIKAAVRYVLNEAAANGDVYLPVELLTERTAALLALEPELIANELVDMHVKGSIWIDKSPEGQAVYLNYFYRAETYVAKKLIELSDTLKVKKNYDAKVSAIEARQGMDFASEQREAVIAAMQNGVLVITGGPGTGKTTVINAILALAEAEGKEVELAAPTGRAAKRMEEATGHSAQTIHRLLGIKFLDEDKLRQSFEKDEDNPIEADIIIIDESSMVDIMLMNSLLNAVADGTRLILVGDADQLPSVGAGNVLKDIIASDCIKVVRLTEIFRQARQSAIVTNAHKINKGEYPDLENKHSDFFMINRNSVESVTQLLVELVAQRLPKYLNCTAQKGIQVLTPMRKSPLGVAALNEVLQKALNPPHRNKNEHEHGSVVFREGDKVMQIKNDYELQWKVVSNGKIIDEGVGMYNGDEGIINYIDKEEKFIEVIFDDNKVVHYDFTQLDKLELSYAVTVHKSQGSEYKAVVMPLLGGPDMLMSRNLLYTGLTRAKELAVIVGLPVCVRKMVDNNKEVNRYTQLKQKLVAFNEL